LTVWKEINLLCTKGMAVTKALLNFTGGGVTK